MKQESVLYLLLTSVIAIGCSSGGKDMAELPFIDVRKNYPEKEIILTDIADVTYVHLDTKNNDYLYKGGIKYITENTIVVDDYSSGSILFFSKDGQPKSRFNRYGNGPEEYFDRFVRTAIYDETTDDVFVCSQNLISSFPIQVYSSAGEFKRKLTLPQGTSPYPIIEFDDQSLFLYDMQKLNRKVRTLGKEKLSSYSTDSSFLCISKTDGKVLEYVEFPSSEIDITDRGDGSMVIMDYRRVVKCATGLLLQNPETDTVFLYGKDKSLTPVFCKTPLVSALDPKVVLANFIDAGKYQFMQVEILVHDDILLRTPRNERLSKFNKYYMRDKQTGEIFRQKISLPDYKGEEFYINATNTRYDGKKTLSRFELDLIKLKQAYRENKLSGKLKELVATLNELEDNNVFMLVNFK